MGDKNFKKRKLYEVGERASFQDFENIKKYNKLKNFQNSNIKFSKILVLEFFSKK